MKRLLLLFSFLLFSGYLFGQQDVQFSQYMFNQMYYNPAYAGMEKKTRVTAIHRIQWLAYQATLDPGKAPQSTIISANSWLKNINTGVGTFFMFETLGPLQIFDAQLALSKHFNVLGGTFGIGASGGILHQSLDKNYRVVDTDDPIYEDLIKGGAAQLNPDVKAGLWFDHARYSFGIGFSHLPRATFSYGLSAVSSALKNHMYVTGSMKLPVGYTLDITPSFITQTDFNQLTYLFGAIAEYQKKVWVGIHARQSWASRDEAQGGKTLNNDDIILYVGIHLLKNDQGDDALRVGYAFDFVTSGRSAKTGTSHEIMVSYWMPPLMATEKPPVWTPRYRQEL